MENLFNNIYSGKKVFVTGHTGFKGSWLCLWLTKMGAEVIGYSQEAPTSPSHFDLLKLPVTSIIGNVLDKENLQKTIAKYQPDIVFHLAAQALVRDSYILPGETFETNIMGTVNVLEACLSVESVKAIVNVTSDKCYQNIEQIWGYRETDPMGGNDPYSASKGATELVAQSYRHSFFNNAQFGKNHHTLLASVRAGNVIGGGDWAKDRLVPDIIRARDNDETVVIRNPHSVRPWQHVLEPLSGYLQIGWKLLEGHTAFADNWNFGPSNESLLTVLEVVENIKEHINGLTYQVIENPDAPHEAAMLWLDSTKARTQLHWKNVWNAQKTFEKTACWYKEYYNDAILMSEYDLADYIQDAQELSVEWTQ